ncbi:hypothetical protein [Cryobacterium sp. BB736]|uniref:VG15 protein n=1 Tax=Cryobacterium sp. BB736 TaxID=2746963 RepID=UPI0018756169|nr:hypothetical protein [Cryobacterium sp. BB736]
MATASQVAAYRTAVDDLSVLAINELNNALLALDGVDPRKVRNTLIAAFPELIGPYITTAGELTAVWYEDLRRAALGGTFYATASGEVNAAQVNALVRWGVRPLFGQSDSTALSLIGGGIQKMVAGAGRHTIDANARKDVASTSWARVARPGACKFCTMLAGRGAVYRSKEAAGLVVGSGSDRTGFDEAGKRLSGGIGGGVKASGNQALNSKFHDFCRCVAKPTFYTIGTWTDPRTGREERSLQPIAA